MAVVEHDADRVPPNRLDPLDSDVLLAGHEDALAGGVPLDLGGRGVDAQVLGVEIRLEAVREAHDEAAGALLQRDLDRFRDHEKIVSDTLLPSNSCQTRRIAFATTAELVLHEAAWSMHRVADRHCSPPNKKGREAG